MSDVIDQMWTGDGPLPMQAMEQAALELFADEHPINLWAEGSYRDERNQARRQIMRAYLRFVQMDRWTLSNMITKLEEGFSRIVFGDRSPSIAEAQQVRDYSEACLEDLFTLFMGDNAARRVSQSFQKPRVQ